MKVKHSIKCHGSEVLVREEGGKYHLSIQAAANPLGSGNVLETFSDKEEAIRAAEQFCKMLTAAKEHGYYLDNGHFVKPERERIPVAFCLKEHLTEELWIAHLNRG
ncbi:hypothetical protein [Paenibacillus ehimensis]|uniref:Uncharacterized protein n=1 Tax=Paenibacillus ehimensis TaxID=79264 RepID=A0ABT8VC07_9BACL|nr:hypothetical protein [Paenibacillus ehimensis]MDO3678513.1 hypothetical protein [Paenibacillus ehimensis]